MALINRRARWQNQRVAKKSAFAYVAAVSKGGKVIAGGNRDGSVVEVTLIDDVTPDMEG